MEIIGLRIEKYIGKSISGDNYKFKYSDADFEKHIICAINSNTNNKLEIELSRSEGECCSGYTTATWGNINVTEVANFKGYTFTPNKRLFINEFEIDFQKNIKNFVFSMSKTGGSEYYPFGGYSVSMELFTETVRSKKFRPVWIFKGKSNSGKSFLASNLNNIDVYETDCYKELPEKIVASVIVSGNKYHFEIEEIKSRIFGKVEIQIVEFQ